MAVEIAKKSRGGRPRKGPIKQGEKVQIGVRVSPALQAQLDKAARESGRSLTQEAEMRLEHTFRQEHEAPSFITAKYGNRIGSLLIMLGSAIRGTGGAAAVAGIVPWKTLAESMIGEDSWLDDPFLFDQAAKAISFIVEAWRPRGEIVEPPDALINEREIGPFAAEQFLQLLSGPKPAAAGTPSRKSGATKKRGES